MRWESGYDGKSVWLGDWLHIDCWVWYFEWLGGETGGDLLGYLGQESKGGWGVFRFMGVFEVFLRVSLILGEDFLDFYHFTTFWCIFRLLQGKCNSKIHDEKHSHNKIFLRLPQIVNFYDRSHSLQKAPLQIPFKKHTILS